MLRSAFRHKKRPHRRKRASEKLTTSQLRRRLRPLPVLGRPMVTSRVTSWKDPKTGVIKKRIIPVFKVHRGIQSSPLKTLKELRDSISIKKLVGVDSIRTTPADHIHCIKRQIRRSILFSNKIAGKHQKRSPGRGGTYNRTEESKLGC